jgi:hypothetical protein
MGARGAVDIAIRRLASGDVSVLDRVADDVFDDLGAKLIHTR